MKSMQLPMLAMVSAIFMITTTPSRASTILMDFGDPAAANQTQVTGWNNITNGGGFTVSNMVSVSGRTLNLIDSSGNPSGITMTVVVPFSAQNGNGITAGGPAAYPNTAYKDSLYGNTESFATGNGTVANIFPVLNFSGFNPSQTYTFKFYASRNSGDHRTTRYTLAGASTNFTDLDPGTNNTFVATLTNIVSDANGVIQYRQTPELATVPPYAPNTQANHFTYLGIMEIDSGALATKTNTVPGGPGKKIAIIGSSTAEGTGATDYAHAWAGLYTAYLTALNPSNTVVNLALGGYTTYQEVPTGTINPGNRPAVDTARNITAALATRPDAVIVNLPSNDAADGYSEAETATNFLKIAAACLASNVPVWISTTQPRTQNTAVQNVLIDEKNWIISAFPNRHLDFWTTIARADGSINTAYSYGDGVHLNNAGHQILYGRVAASQIYELVCVPRAFNIRPGIYLPVIYFDTVPGINYALESSPDLVNWQAQTNIPGDGAMDSLAVPATNPPIFFRLRLSAAQ